MTAEPGRGGLVGARLLLWCAPASAALLFAGVALAVSIGAPAHDTALLALVLAVAGLGSLILALILLRVTEQSPRFGLTVRLLIPGALATLVMLINVWVAAALMFISRRDVVLLAVMLGYAVVLAMIAAFMLAGSITLGLRRLTAAVALMAAGDGGARVPVDSADEIGALATAFNTMASRLQLAAEERSSIEAARRSLLAAVSHDLRTPLSAIRAMLEAIEDGVVEDTETVRRYQATMLGEIERLNTLINDLFELSRIEAGALGQQREQVDIGSVLGEAVETMQAEAGRAGVSLTVAVPSDLPLVAADPVLIHRVALNLVTNALRHTPAEGSVAVSAGCTDGNVVVSVADSGEGIDPDDLPHVFERFYRADKSRSRAGGGTGLGLAIARGIVEMHGGSIRATSVLGAGSTFTFLLPAA